MITTLISEGVKLRLSVGNVYKVTLLFGRGAGCGWMRRPAARRMVSRPLQSGRAQSSGSHTSRLHSRSEYPYTTWKLHADHSILAIFWCPDSHPLPPNPHVLTPGSPNCLLATLVNTCPSSSSSVSHRTHFLFLDVIRSSAFFLEHSSSFPPFLPPAHITHSGAGGLCLLRSHLVTLPSTSCVSSYPPLPVFCQPSSINFQIILSF